MNCIITSIQASLICWWIDDCHHVHISNINISPLGIKLYQIAALQLKLKGQITIFEYGA